MRYRGLRLDEFQVRAIEALRSGRDVLVSAPTGTGKTVVADWAVEHALAGDRRVVYTAPIKALSNQKFRDYGRLLGEERVGLVTGDLVIRPEAPVRVMTTEILRNMLLAGDPVEDLGLVVVDEIHFLDDADRGTTWEELLIYLPRRVQVVGLSATLSNLDDLAAWLSEVRGAPIEVVREDRRAVPLRFAVACREAGLRSPEEMARFHRGWLRRNAYALQRAARLRGRHPRREVRVGARTRHHHVFSLLWPEYAPYLYFVYSRRDAEGMARALVRRLDRPLLDREERRRVERALDEFRAEPGGESALDPELERMLRAGVAYHHAGMHVLLKTLVERLYERRLVQVLYCTGTFALGINMPARTAAFEGLMRFDGRRMIPLPVREFMQMAGRAGRRGMDDEGLVVVRADIDEMDQVLPRLGTYVEGRPEPVHSRFGLSFNSVAHLLHRHPPDRIRELVERSFLAWHRARLARRDAARADRLEAELARAGWRPGEPVPKALRKKVRRLQALRRSAEEARERTWNEFRERVEFLERWGYVDEHGGFNAGGRALLHVQFSEVFVVELLLEGILDELEIPNLFGVLCGICHSLPRAAAVHAERRHRWIARRIAAVRMSDPVREAERLTGVEFTWDPRMVPLGRLWAEGAPLEEILRRIAAPTDIAGDLVGAFRRARDLAGQLCEAWAEQPDRAGALRDVIRATGRDEVEVVA